MKQASWIILCLGIAMAMAMASPANADLVGLRVFREEPGGAGAPPPGPQRWIYRVYAEFTQPTDMVGTWGTGSTGFGFGGIWNMKQDESPGSGFTNIPDLHTGDIAPFFSGGATDWDTYMTIGVLYGVQGPSNMDYTVTFSNTPLFIANATNQWAGPGGVGLLGDIQQGFANYRVAGNDTENRVLLMQLVVNVGEHVHGRIGISWRSDGGSFVTTPDVTFNSLPSPASLLVFTFFALGNNRVRR